MAKFPEVNWNASDIAGEFRLFRQQMELSLQDQDITDPAKSAIKIKIAVGKEGLKEN